MVLPTMLLLLKAAMHLVLAVYYIARLLGFL
jgi:hypothetical protein